MADATVDEIRQSILNKIAAVIAAPDGAFTEYRIGNKEVDMAQYLDWLRGMLKDLDGMGSADIEIMTFDVARINPITGADEVEYER